MTATSLADFLQRQVEKNPQKEAVVHGELRVSYGMLWERIVGLADFMRRQGVRSGDRAILFMDNSSDYVVAYYALIRLAAVPVPLNTGLKGQQLAHIIRHAQPRLLLHDGKLEERSGPRRKADGSAPLMINLAKLHPLTRSLDNEPVSCNQASLPGQLNTIMYTSGTTGRPKGVMLSASNLLSNTLAIIDYLALSKRDKVMCVLPFFYAYGNSVLHTHLAVGATLVLENNLVYPRRVLETMDREEVTGFAGVPSTFRLLLARGDLACYPLPRLRYVTQAGGAMSVEDIDRVRALWRGIRFFVMYGQTEATARLSYLPPERLVDKSSTVGVPVRDVSLKIMDKWGKEKPRGEVGEICACGPNIMLGYWRDPAATEARFIGNWLRTGDLGFQDKDGFTTIVGRSSDIIKVGDHRVAPEEVEQVIAALDGVEEVAVAGIPDRVLGQVIKAFVVPARDVALSKRDILRRCKQECAQYKIPRAIDFLSALPKTASGKVQRYKLVNGGEPEEQWRVSTTED